MSGMLFFIFASCELLKHLFLHAHISLLMQSNSFDLPMCGNKEVDLLHFKMCKLKILASKRPKMKKVLTLSTW